MKWRTHDEKPATTEPVTALLAMPDEEGDEFPPILLGMYLWRNGHWITENEGTRAKEPYWWVLEDEVVPTIKAAPVTEVAATIKTFDGDEPAILVAASWVVMARDYGLPKGGIDYACPECIPDGGSIDPDFRCNYHRALAVLSPQRRLTCCGEWDTIGTKCGDCPHDSSRAASKPQEQK